MNRVGDHHHGHGHAVHADLQVDHGLAAWRTICSSNGSDGLVVAGTTGESPTLTDDEKVAMFRHVVEVAGGRGRVIAGTGSNDTAHSVPSRGAPKTPGSTRCWSSRRTTTSRPSAASRPLPAIAAATTLPVIIYNIPSRCVDQPAARAPGRPGRDREHRRRQAGEPRPRRVAAAARAVRPRPLRGQRRHAARRLAPGRLGLASVWPATSSAARMQGVRAAARAGDIARRAAHRRASWRRSTRRCSSRPTPSREGRAELLGHEVGGLRLPLVEASTTTARRRGRARAARPSAGLDGRGRPAAAPARAASCTTGGNEDTMTDTLKIIPLGGMGEIGKNMTAVEYGGKIVVRRLRPRLPARRDAGHRPRPARHLLPARAARRRAGLPHHPRPRGPLRRPALRAARASTCRSTAAGSRWRSPSRSSTSTAC